MSESVFDHERLDVYRVAIEFVAWVGELIDGPLRGCGLSAVSQLDRASTSIPLNIAEGNGKRTSRDRSRYLDTARGSAFESAAALDVLVARRALGATQVTNGKTMLHRNVQMLSRMATNLQGQAAKDVYSRSTAE
jgi:four helix bundle protein